MDDLEVLRAGIAEVDAIIMDQVARRMELARMVGQFKQANGLPIRDHGVEGGVRQRYRDLAQIRGIGDSTADGISSTLIAEAVDQQSNLALGEGSKVLVVGGGGKMGGWMVRFLSRRGHEVRISDPEHPGSVALESGAIWADVVVVATPISVVGEAIENLVEIGTDALVFDISSLKSPFMETLRSAAAAGLRVCSAHPMFGPETPSVHDCNIVVCPVTPGAAEEASALLGGGGSHIIILDLEEHEHLMSVVLGMSHAMNIVFFTALRRSGIRFDDLMRVASVTFRKHVDTATSVGCESPFLYYEIQHLNPNSAMIWGVLSQAVDEVTEAALDDDPAAFTKLMMEGRLYLSSDGR